MLFALLSHIAWCWTHFQELEKVVVKSEPSWRKAAESNVEGKANDQAVDEETCDHRPQTKQIDCRRSIAFSRDTMFAHVGALLSYCIGGY